MGLQGLGFAVEKGRGSCVEGNCVVLGGGGDVGL